MKVLVTLKSIDHSEKLGGVESYFKVLKDYYPENIAYFNFSHVKSKSNHKKLFQRLLNSIRFFKICRSRHNRFDLVHLNPSLSWGSVFRDGFFLLIASKSKKKTIIFFRGWHEYMVKKIERNRIIRFFFKKVYGKADAFIVLSAAFKNKLREWGFKQTVYVETTLIDDELINKPGVQQHRKSKNNINILFLARVEKYKGVFEALETYKMLKDKNPQVSLTIAGDGGQLKSVQEAVTRQGIKDVGFTGYVTGEKKAQTLTESDIYLLPTYGEGMPNSVLEAMAFGLPVITRPVGGLNDFFEDGKMGYLTESKDPKVYTELIEKLITNPELRKQVSEYNAAFARKHFLASNVAKRLENIYREVLDGKAEDKTWMDNFGPF